MSLPIAKLRNPEIRGYVNEHFNRVSRLVSFGAALLADVDKVVVSVDMKVGAYTIAAQPDIPRNITVTVTATDTADTMGTVVVVGTDIEGQPITETITPAAGSTVAGTKAFKTVTSVTGAGWVVDAAEGTKDKITVGIGTALGLPFKIIDNGQVLLGVVGTALVAPVVAHSDRVVSECTVDLSAGTYNGTKAVMAFVVE